MSVAAAMRRPRTHLGPAHPNELDLRRISRALEQRQRYRYVDPSVTQAKDGYLVRAACCSRNIDPAGGEIDIASVRWDGEHNHYVLLWKDHKADEWHEDTRFARLSELLERLNSDPQRIFWQ